VGVAIPFPATVRQSVLRPYGAPALSWDLLLAECVRATCAAVQHAGKRADLAQELRPALERMLDADEGMKRLRGEEERFLADEPGNAVHCTHFMLARCAAVVHWLLHASEGEREDYAARTLGIDPRRGEAYRRLRRAIGELSLPDGVDGLLEQSRGQLQSLLAELDGDVTPEVR
jgi:hypothetical protein